MRMLATMAMLLLATVTIQAGEPPEKDALPTGAGDLTMTFLGHGTLLFTLGGTVVHVDPWSAVADYASLPKADLVLITHEHQDHLDPKAVAAVRKETTRIVVNEAAAAKLPGGTVLHNGESLAVAGIGIQAVPAYNVVHRRENGQPFHPRGAGNGYVLAFADRRIYVAGDTENIPEMAALQGIDVAFLPVNLPYTMTPEMLADAARSFRPRILYPYHQGETDLSRVTALLKDSGIEVRLRRMK